MDLSFNRGFTLIEMMVTVAVMTIALAIAAPNLMAFVNASRVKSITENMAQDLMLARAEAIRGNRPIYLNVQSTCYGMSANGAHCDCTVTNTGSTNYCEVKRVPANSLTLTPDSGQFDKLIFDSVRGLPVSNTFGTLTSTQNIAISNSTGLAKIKLTIIGGVCISSPSGAKKLAGYPNAC